MLAWLRQTGRRYVIGRRSRAEVRLAESLRSQGLARGPRRRRGQAGTPSRDRRDGDPMPLGRSTHQRAGHARQVQRADRFRPRAPGRSYRRRLKETARSDESEPADRPHPAEEPTRRRPLRHHIGARWLRRPVSASEIAYNAAFDDWAALSEGAYLLRSNITDWSDQQLWKAYIQLTQAEAAFRIQKDQLNVRPIWHQREDRVQAHILVCFLAFVLWKSLERCGSSVPAWATPRAPCLMNSPASNRMTSCCQPRRMAISVCVASTTSRIAQASALLDRLGIVLPKRMRLAEQNLPALPASA